jgi:hypothetical protein
MDQTFKQHSVFAWMAAIVVGAYFGVRAAYLPLGPAITEAWNPTLIPAARRTEDDDLDEPTGLYCPNSIPEKAIVVKEISKDHYSIAERSHLAQDLFARVPAEIERCSRSSRTFRRVPRSRSPAPARNSSSVKGPSSFTRDSMPRKASSGVTPPAVSLEIPMLSVSSSVRS